MSRCLEPSASISANTLNRPLMPLLPCLLSWNSSFFSTRSTLNLIAGGGGSSWTVAPVAKHHRFLSKHGFSDRFSGLPSIMPFTRNEALSVVAVKALTSCSAPKSLTYGCPSQHRFCFVEQCWMSTGAPAMTGTPSLTSRFVGSGVSTVHTVSNPSLAVSTTSWLRLNLAKCVVVTGPLRRYSGSSPPALCTSWPVHAGLATILNFWP
mmetsp:Transcript_23287/g.79245  ORF Transcript_23287/g.79245 Transcript_23287/m.79245 type:complete len:208 (+) Transcript_23287:271-894(+)